LLVARRLQEKKGPQPIAGLCLFVHLGGRSQAIAIKNSTDELLRALIFADKYFLIGENQPISVPFLLM
jgi:hypothetical protein